jgi:hypothetical protein
LRFGDGTLMALLKLPAICADVATAWLIALALRRRPPADRIGACALYAFNPAFWYVTAY